MGIVAVVVCSSIVILLSAIVIILVAVMFFRQKRKKKRFRRFTRLDEPNRSDRVGINLGKRKSGNYHDHVIPRQFKETREISK